MKKQSSQSCSRIRLDNSLVIEFVTGMTSVLGKRGLISDKDSDNIRILLNGIHSSPSERQNPILPECLRQNKDLFTILVARYGLLGLNQNIFCHTLRPEFVNLRSIFSDFGSQLIEKSRLFFNRRFQIYTEGQPEKSVLYSTILIDVAELIENSLKAIDGIIQETSLMTQHSMAGDTTADTDVDTEIASALGFSGLNYHSLPQLAERRILQQLALTIDTISTAILELNQQTSLGREDERSANIEMSCQTLRLEGHRLTSLPTTSFSSLENMEIRRQNLVHVIWSIKDQFQALNRNFIAAISEAGIQEAPINRKISQDVQRRLCSQLVAKGVGPSEANKAMTDLSEYLRSHSLQPRDLIVSELRKVNSHLAEDSLNTLQEHTGGNTLNKISTIEKSMNWKRSQSLLTGFAKFAPHAGKILTLMLLFGASGCGLKTTPSSGVIDFRPEVPFQDAGFRKKSKRPKDKAAAQSKKSSLVPFESKGSIDHE